eukprot:3545766-Amphidinium_carterae.1
MQYPRNTHTIACLGINRVAVCCHSDVCQLHSRARWQSDQHGTVDHKHEEGALTEPQVGEDEDASVLHSHICYNLSPMPGAIPEFFWV